MEQTTVYIKCERKIQCNRADVYLQDVGDIYCSDARLLEKIKNIRIHHFKKEESQQVLSVVLLAKKIDEVFPQVNVQFFGEADLVLEKVQGTEEKRWMKYAKIVFVCLISFFGTAFTIMAYHNDIGINEIFREIYRICMNREPSGINVLQVSYSVGLAVGIVLFFNHVGGKHITKDPTPIEVAMNNYDKDVDMTIIEKNSRGKKGDKWR